MMSYLIYKATNTVNGKIYIGLTKQTIQRRMNKHVSDAMRGKTKCLFHAAIRKYGRESFSLEAVFETENLPEARLQEITFIEQFGSTDRQVGYNMIAGGEGNYGYVFTDEHKANMSEAWRQRRETNTKRKPVDRTIYAQRWRVRHLETDDVRIIDDLKSFCSEQTNLNYNSILSYYSSKQKPYKGYLFTCLH